MAKYSKGTQDKVEKVMHEFKEGDLKSGSTDKKVTSKKQAIAIGLSEAREKGEKVPNKKSSDSKSPKSKSSTSSSHKKTTAKKSAAKKS